MNDKDIKIKVSEISLLDKLEKCLDKDRLEIFIKFLNKYFIEIEKNNVIVESVFISQKIFNKMKEVFGDNSSFIDFNLENKNRADAYLWTADIFIKEDLDQNIIFSTNFEKYERKEMDIKKSLLYKAISKVLSKEKLVKVMGEINEKEVIITCHDKHDKKLVPTKPRTNEKIIHDIEELDPKGEIRKLHKGIPWSSDEEEKESWGHMISYTKIAGVARFIERRSRPYEKTVNINSCQKRRKFKKMSQKKIDKKYKNYYKVGERNGIKK